MTIHKFYENPQSFINLDDRPPSTPNYNVIPSLKISLNGQEIKSILDTGAQISLISKHIIERDPELKKALVPIKKMNIIATNNKRLGTISNSLNIIANLNGNSHIMRFFVFDQLMYDAIVGIDNIRKLQMILNFTNNKITIEGKDTRMEEPQIEIFDTECRITEIKEDEEDERKKKLVYNIKDDNKKIIMVKEEIKSEGSSAFSPPLQKIIASTEAEVEEEKFMYENDFYHFHEDLIEDNEFKDYLIKNNKKINIDDFISKLNLEAEEASALEAILKQNSIVYNSQTIFAKDYEHQIIINDHTPFNSNPYPIPQAYRKQVDEHIQDLLKQGIIKKSNSCYISPVVIIHKKDNSIRLCLDARKINKRIQPAYEAPINIDILLSRCHGSNIFTKLDLQSAFYLLPLTEASKQYCSFKVGGEIFSFQSCAFGIRCSPSALIRFLNKILNEFNAFSSHYFDDILIFSKNREQHIEHVRTIIQKLGDNGMKINLDKCQFFQTEVPYLGHLINQKGITLVDEKYAEIQNFARPKKIKELRAFLGLINYYKRFIDNHSRKTVPLLKLLKKNIKWNWGPEQENAFINVKNNFIKNLLLCHPDFSQPFLLRSDASHNAVASEIVQIQNNVEVPIQFTSRILRDQELRYTVTEKELYAIIHGVTKFRYYLLGRPFKIQTDHIALTHILDKRFANNRIYRWSLLLNEYDFEICYLPGKNMIAPDILSRQFTTTKPEDIVISNVNLKKYGPCSYAKIKNIQETNVYLQSLKELIQQHQGQYKGYFIKGNLIAKHIGRTQVYVLEPVYTSDIIRKLHLEYHHIGIRKTWLLFREAFYCKNDQKLIASIISACKTCQLAKQKNHKYEYLPRSIITQNKLEIIAIDYLSNLPRSSKGYRNVLVIVDVFTKFIKLVPTQNCDTDSTLQGLYEFFQEHGNPKIVLSDNASYFNNDRYRQSLQERNIKAYYTTIRHPSSNVSERYVKECIKFLRIMLADNHHLWAKHLKKIEYVINNTPHLNHEQTPYYLMIGQHSPRHWNIEEIDNLQDIYEEVRQKLQSKADKWQEKEGAKRKRLQEYHEGDSVLIKNYRVTNKRLKQVAKLMPAYIGPYIVDQRIGDTTYILIDPETATVKGRFHCTLLCPFIKEV